MRYRETHYVMPHSTPTLRHTDSTLRTDSPIRASWRAPSVLPGIHPIQGRGFVAISDIAEGALLFEVTDYGHGARRQGTSEDIGDARAACEAEYLIRSESRARGKVDTIELGMPGNTNARLVDSRRVVATRTIRNGEFISVDFSRHTESSTIVVPGGESVVSSGIGILLRFLKGALKQEWGAAVVSFTSAIPSNLLSCAIVIWGADWLEDHKVFESETAYITAVSILTGFVGYATYLIGYYGGMLIKERADLLDEGVFSWNRFRRKCRVIWYDFVIHLPSDFYSLPLLSAGQGGMYVAGVSQFWSIFWAQAIADALSAVKEPFFWYGAKQLADFTERAANDDQVDSPDKRVAND